jgi:hypothetical protein
LTTKCNERGPVERLKEREDVTGVEQDGEEGADMMAAGANPCYSSALVFTPTLLRCKLQIHQANFTDNALGYGDTW